MSSERDTSDVPRKNWANLNSGGPNTTNGLKTTDTCFDPGMLLVGCLHGKETRRTDSFAKMAEHLEYIPPFVLSFRYYLTTQQHSVILDATRLSDGAFVTLKVVMQAEHPHEVEIGQFFSSEPLRSHPSNHCVPIYEVLRVPTDLGRMIIVMPLLREYTSPPFSTIGEALECFRQLFEVDKIVLLICIM